MGTRTCTRTVTGTGACREHHKAALVGDSHPVVLGSQGWVWMDVDLVAHTGRGTARVRVGVRVRVTVRGGVFH